MISAFSESPSMKTATWSSRHCSSAQASSDTRRFDGTTKLDRDEDYSFNLRSDVNHKKRKSYSPTSPSCNGAEGAGRWEAVDDLALSWSEGAASVDTYEQTAVVHRARKKISENTGMPPSLEIFSPDGCVSNNKASAVLTRPTNVLVEAGILGIQNGEITVTPEFCQSTGNLLQKAASPPIDNHHDDNFQAPALPDTSSSFHYESSNDGDRNSIEGTTGLVAGSLATGSLKQASSGDPSNLDPILTWIKQNPEQAIAIANSHISDDDPFLIDQHTMDEDEKLANFLAPLLETDETQDDAFRNGESDAISGTISDVDGPIDAKVHAVDGTQSKASFNVEFTDSLNQDQVTVGKQIVASGIGTEVVLGKNDAPKNDHPTPDGDNPSSPIPSPNTVDVLDSDVVCGLGRGMQNHPGNKKYRELIKSQICKYHDKNNTKRQKSDISKGIVNQILQQGSRFVKPVEDENGAIIWRELTFDEAWYKVKGNIRWNIRKRREAQNRRN